MAARAGIAFHAGRGGARPDGGGRPGGTSALEFRGLKAFDGNHAVLMSVGSHPDGVADADSPRRRRGRLRACVPLALAGRAIGGDFTTPASAPHALALTGDGGRTWRLAPDARAPHASRSGTTWVPHPAGTALAVGLTGGDISTHHRPPRPGVHSAGERRRRPAHRAAPLAHRRRRPARPKR